MDSAADGRMVVVEDDDVNRLGITGLLADCDGIELLAALTHQEAMRWEGPWDEVDVVLVDAVDARVEDDQFPGVAVALASPARSPPDCGRGGHRPLRQRRSAPAAPRGAGRLPLSPQPARRGNDMRFTRKVFAAVSICTCVATVASSLGVIPASAASATASGKIA